MKLSKWTKFIREKIYLGKREHMAKTAQIPSQGINMYLHVCAEDVSSSCKLENKETLSNGIATFENLW